MGTWSLLVAPHEGSHSADCATQELDQAREANVVTAAIAAVSAIAASLPWPQYQQLLGQFLRLMKRYADSNKVRRLLLQGLKQAALVLLTTA